MNAVADICQKGGTVALDPAVGTFQEMDEWASSRGLTVTFASWHPSPEYRCFLTNPQWPDYPSGLVLVDDRGRPNRFQPS